MNTGEPGTARAGGGGWSGDERCCGTKRAVTLSVDLSQRELEVLLALDLADALRKVLLAKAAPGFAIG